MTPECAQEVRRLLEAGLPVREVARRTHASYSYVHKQAMRMGRQMTRSHPNPDTHPWAKKHPPCGS